MSSLNNRRQQTAQSRLVCIPNQCRGAAAADRWAAALARLVVPLGVLLCHPGGSIAQEEQNRDLIRSLGRPLQPQTDLSKWQRLGTNAVPLLNEALQTKPGALDKAYAWGWSNLPANARLNVPAPADADQMRLRASWLLAQAPVGTQIPTTTLIQALTDPYWGVRMNGLACLNQVVLPKSGPKVLGNDEEKILSLVLSAARNPQMEVRMSAVYCLGHFKEPSDRVIPVLTKALNDDYPDVRVRAAIAFHRLAPAQAEKAGALSVALDCLHYNAPHGSKVLAYEFLKEQGKLPPDEVP